MTLSLLAAVDGCTICSGGNNGCGGNLCIGEGDCDRDSHCAMGLRCGSNNCNAFRSAAGWPGNSGGWDRTDDCCYDPNCGNGYCSPPPSPPPPPPPSPPSQPDYTGTIVGISSGAIALIILIGVSCYIVAKRTAPMRAAWARKAALRKPLTACGLTRHLQQAGVGDDEQVLVRAAAWVTAHKPASVEDLIRFGMVRGFVDSLILPSIPRQKLIAALEGPQHEEMPVATGTVVDEEAYGTELGGVGSWLSGSAGSASSSSAQPTLSQAVEILKRELGLEGNFKDVIEQAAAQLGLEPGPALAELAQQCLRELHPGKTQAV